MQIGGALGLAVLSTVATSRFNDLIKADQGPTGFASALVGGYHGAFLTGALLLAVGAVLVYVLLPSRRTTETEAEEETLVA